jgi:hypothetical protein
MWRRPHGTTAGRLLGLLAPTGLTSCNVDPWHGPIRAPGFDPVEIDRSEIGWLRDLVTAVAMRPPALREPPGSA